MQPRILPTQTLLIIAFIGCAFLASVFLLSSKIPVPSILAPIVGQERVRSGLPMRLTIPSIDVDSAVEYVGIAPDGSMDVPKDQLNVAWYELGPRPGEIGSAVIAGHYGWKDGKAAAFDDLNKLRKGDKIYVEDENGLITTFVVRESRRYDPNADASDVFGSKDGKAHLNLVTCEGEWNKKEESYSKRLVVFADREETL